VCASDAEAYPGGVNGLKFTPLSGVKIVRVSLREKFFHYPPPLTKSFGYAAVVVLMPRIFSSKDP